MADLRPMEFGEILDGALSLFRRHFGLFLKLSLAVMWLPIALGVYWRVRFLGLSAANPEQAAALLQGEVLSFSLWALAWALIYGAGMLLLTAGSIRIIADSYLGREPQFGEALGFGVGKIVPLFLVGLGKSLLLILIGVLCGVVIAVTAAAGKALGPGVVILGVFVEVVRDDLAGAVRGDRLHGDHADGRTRDVALVVRFLRPLLGADARRPGTGVRSRVRRHADRGRSCPSSSCPPSVGS